MNLREIIVRIGLTTLKLFQQKYNPLSRTIVMRDRNIFMTNFVEKFSIHIFWNPMTSIKGFWNVDNKKSRQSKPNLKVEIQSQSLCVITTWSQ